MTIALPWIIAGGIAALVGAGVLVALAVERKRRAAYEEYCLVRGFRFEPERPAGERRFGDVFEPFSQGRRRTWGYTISGTKNRMPFTAFEYAWVTGSGKHSSTHRVSGVCWEQDGLSLPKFALSPEGWFTRLGEMFGMQDIDFPDSPEFSKAYRLKGPDESGIRARFTTDLRHFFAATPDQHVAAGGRFLFWYRRARLPAVEELDEWLERGDHVRRRFMKE